MNPQERIKAVKKDLDQMASTGEQYPFDTIEWLVARVEQLEVALNGVITSEVCRAAALHSNAYHNCEKALNTGPK